MADRMSVLRGCPRGEAGGISDQYRIHRYFGVINTQYSDHIMQRIFRKFGIHLVRAELARRGIASYEPEKRLDRIDIIAHEGEASQLIHVKTLKSGTFGIDVTRYLDIKFDNDKQYIDGLSPKVNKELIYIFVLFSERYGADRFFIMPEDFLAENIWSGYQRYLDAFNGTRPRNPKSTHSSVGWDMLVLCEDDWRAIERRLRPLTD